MKKEILLQHGHREIQERNVRKKEGTRIREKGKVKTHKIGENPR